jgi:hypothetical protein
MERAASRGAAGCTGVASEICHGAVCGSQLHVLDWMLAAGHIATGSSALAVAALQERAAFSGVAVAA